MGSMGGMGFAAPFAAPFGDPGGGAVFGGGGGGGGDVDEVGRCRLTVSNAVLKAPMVSALRTMIC